LLINEKPSGYAEGLDSYPEGAPGELRDGGASSMIRRRTEPRTGKEQHRASTGVTVVPVLVGSDLDKLSARQSRPGRLAESEYQEPYYETRTVQARMSAPSNGKSAQGDGRDSAIPGKVLVADMTDMGRGQGLEISNQESSLT